MGTALSHEWETHLWTSLPRFAFQPRYRKHIHSLLFPEIVYRLGRTLGADNWGDLYKMRRFGKSLAKRLGRVREPDTYIGWSSFSLETLRQKTFPRTALFRDSSHIVFQNELLKSEYTRFGIPLADRSIAIERECEEYELADEILVLSEFARRTFLQRGIAAQKVRVIRLGVDTDLFRPSSRRYEGGKLKVVYFGSLSLRKGIAYLLDAAENMKGIELTLIGPVESHLRSRLELAVRNGVRVLGAMPQTKMAAVVAESDVFVLPTLEDGFGQTLVQAMAAGIVPISTDRCGAAERIVSQRTGFLIPAAKSDPIGQILEKLRDTPSLVQQVKSQLVRERQGLTWDAYSKDVSGWLLGSQTSEMVEKIPAGSLGPA